MRTPALDALRARQMDNLRVVIELTRSTDADIRHLAVRALGRYERRDLTALLVQLFATDQHPAVVEAIAQSMRGEPLPNDRGEQLRGVLDLLRGGGTVVVAGNEALFAARARALGRLPYTDAGQVALADAALAQMLAELEPLPRQADELFAITRGLESLARRNNRIRPLVETTIELLRRVVVSRGRSHAPEVRASAMGALVAARGVDAETLRIAAGATASADLRRLAATTLGGAASTVPPTERIDLLTTLLSDRAAMVRLEALRAWVRQVSPTLGCDRVVEAFADPSPHVALAAIDALGDACRADASMTDRLVAEARTPPQGEHWHRAAHALVALARRAPERMAVPILGFITHPTWQVRMYAAQAAGIANDVTTLERLARDAHHNVREATLAPLRRLEGVESEPYFLEALKGTDDQLLRTAAIELKGAAPSTRLADALADALTRLTAERRDVSRDARIALLERLRELGDENQSGVVVPLLRDFDITVAQAASATLTAWTGKPHESAPEPLARPPLPSAGELADAARETFRVRLGNGGSFRIKLRPDIAPLTSVRFMRLAKSGFYDGLSFHRVVANFVVQGGSPGANEYAGEGPHMRDEISAAMHVRGTVGMSTRGRDTGDMQIFVNLVDNPRLDFDYTILGEVLPEDLDVVDSIVEGTRIADVSIVKKDDKAGGR